MSGTLKQVASDKCYKLSNVVETALAKALVLAAEAERWNVVVQIADELRRRGSTQTSSARWARHPSKA